jgi:hypothetical protein
MAWRKHRRASAFGRQGNRSIGKKASSGPHRGPDGLATP